MFNLFKTSPVKKLNIQYQNLLKQGMEAQRSGDLRKYADLTQQAEAIYKQIKLQQEVNPEG